MGPIEQLLNQLGQRGDPRALPLRREEVAGLIDALRARLRCGPSDLDLSIESLRRLESQLLRLAQEGPFSSRVDVLKLVRELVAYIGQVLANQAQGRWEFGPNLWATYVVYDRTVRAIKGRETRTYPSAMDVIGNIAASSLDAIDAGMPPDLQTVYKRAIAPVVRERLSPRKPHGSTARKATRRRK